jgi:hypothetical protein
MVNSFSFKRFSLLVQYQWSVNRKSYTLLWAALTLILLVLSFISESRPDTFGYFILVFALTGTLISTTGFIRWDNFSRSSLLLLLPATITEKFLCNLFYGLILYIPAYLITFVLVRYALLDLILLTISTNGLSLPALIKSMIKDISYFHFNFYVFALLNLLFIQSIWMLTSVGFKKWQFLYAVVIIAGIWLIYNCCISLLMHVMTHINSSALRGPGILLYNLTDFGYKVSSGNLYALRPGWEIFFVIKVIYNINNLVWFCIFGMIYTAAWYKFKEREI